MKRVTRGGWVLLMAMVIGGCSSSKVKINYRNPKSVALAFTKGILTMDIPTAQRAGTEDTKAVLNLLETLLETMPEKRKAALQAEMEDNLKYLKKATCTVDGDHAKCTTCCDNLGQAQEEFILLKKVDKKWLVDMKKEALMGQ